MLRKFLLLTIFVALSVQSSYAHKSLSLSDAVMEQYGKFRPDYIFNFQWIPETSNYSFVEKFMTLVIVESRRKRKTEIKIEEINEKLGSKLRWFSGFNWVSDDSFELSDGRNFYTYNIEEKKGKTDLSVPDDIVFENGTYSRASNCLAYTKDNNLYIFRNGKEEAVTSNSDLNIVSGQAIARSEFGITNGIFWSPDGKYLAFYQKDETNVANYPLLDITKTPGIPNMIKYPMAGLMSEQPKVGIYNLASKQTKYIEPRGAKHDYLTNLSWSTDSKHLLIAEVTRGQDEMNLNLYNSNGAFQKTLVSEKNNRYVEPEHPAFFISDAEFIWMSERSGNTNLYLVNFEGKLDTLTTNKWEALSIEGISRNGKNLYFSGTGENPTETKFYQLELKSKKQTELTKEPGTHSGSVSPNGMLFFHQFSSSTVPNLAKIVDSRGRTLETLVKAEEKLKEFHLGQNTIGKLKSKSGVDLYYRMIKPSSFDSSKTYPVMVYVYGGPHAQLVTNSWLNGASLWMHWMAEQGYLVFTLDNRGSAHRGFDFESCIHRQLGTLEIEDQMTGVDFLKSLPYVDAKRMAVHGWSFGGFMTVSMMLRTPGVFTTGVAGGPVTDWKYYEVMYGERYMDTPETNEEGYKQASLLNKAENLQGKLLLIHGGIDDVVVPQHTQSLLKSFIDAGKKVDFFEYPTHKHNVRGKDRVHLMEMVLNYIIEHNS